MVTQTRQVSGLRAKLRSRSIEAYQRDSLLVRELGSGVRASYTKTKSGFWWCKLNLPEQRFNRAWVCSPGESRADALHHAITRAKAERIPGDV